MDLPTDNDLSKALHQNGIHTHLDLLNISDKDRVALEYIDDSNSKVLLKRGDRSLVRIFQAFVYQIKVIPFELEI